MRLTRRGAVGVITIDNPPVNALSLPVRLGLLAALDLCARDRAVAAVLIRAAGRTWPVGADLAELAGTVSEPHLARVCDRIAEFAKPVVCALRGTVLGGGLELALAAHLRLAEPGTRLGLPEIKLGLCPGAGGTQRLPRLVGAAQALEMMLSGEPVPVEAALDIGLVDAILSGGDDEAERIAAANAGTAPAQRPPRDGNAAFLAAVAAERSRIRARPGPRLPAPGRIVDCAEASILLPPRAAAVMERTAFEDLLATPESRALRHIFRAERLAGRHPRTDGVLATAPAHVAIAGGGAAGADLAGAFLGAWMTVSLGAEDADALAAGLSRIAAAEEMAVEQGRMTPEARDAEWARLSGGLGLEGFEKADVGVLVGPRAAEAARAAAQALQPGAVLVLADLPGDLSPHAAASGRGADVIGLTLAMPPGAPRRAAGALAEILAPAGASSSAVATGVALARAIRAVPVVTRVPLVDLVQLSLQRAADILIELGASPYAIDKALQGWGLAEGPFLQRDRYEMADRPAFAQPGPVLRVLSETMEGRGRSGLAAGKGFYAHPANGGAAQEDAEFVAILSAARATAGRPVRPVRTFSPAFIASLAVAVLANEGARLLTAKAIARPADLDVAAVIGAGYPRWRGGPMMAADEAGLLQLRNLLRRVAEELGDATAVPDPLWDELILNGRKFDDLNAA